MAQLPESLPPAWGPVRRYGSRKDIANSLYLGAGPPSQFTNADQSSGVSADSYRSLGIRSREVLQSAGSVSHPVRRHAVGARETAFSRAELSARDRELRHRAQGHRILRGASMELLCARRGPRDKKRQNEERQGRETAAR